MGLQIINSKNKMNSAVIIGFLRHVLTFGGGILVSNGTITEPDLQTGVGALSTIIGILWSVYDKKKNA